jgi:hypothetical protein
MRILMTLLLLGVVFSVLSAITGIQSVYSDSRSGTVITYWHGYGRLLALGYAAVLALAFYGIYQRYPFMWKLGFVVWYLSAADCIFEAWRTLLPQPYGWVGATAATVCVPLWRFTGPAGGAGRKSGFFEMASKRPNQVLKPTRVFWFAPPFVKMITLRLRARGLALSR